MRAIGAVPVAVLVALFVGFTAAFTISPDPTGTLPLAVGAGITAVLTPLAYVGIRSAGTSDLK
ncbi:hypothetical protein [Natrinema marinum]|uniref:hypothetical protein n=1 Tax=Natrinema marinum TaxID=2961598 RepID=UPI0020C92181|nr:hypothetical protein [Natrinema marinum]